MMQEIEILLVEDNASDAEMTIRALKKNNLANKLLHVRDGSLALDYLFCSGAYESRRAVRQPNLVLLDLKMPKVGGIEVLRKVKSDIRTQTVPVVILSSSMEDPDIQTCYQLGANGYVVKPVAFDAFYKAITEVGLYWMIVNQPPL